MEPEQTTPEEQVGGGTEGDGRVAVGQGIDLVLLQMDAVGKDRAGAGQTVVGIDIQIVLRSGNSDLTQAISFLFSLR